MKGALLATLVVVAIAAASALPTSTNGNKMVVCYYGSWATYRHGAGKFDVEQIDPFICTHIVYGFVGLGPDNRILVLDPYNDLAENWGKGAMKRFTGLKKLNHNLKVSLAIGGWNEGSEKYSQMVASASARRTFIESSIALLQSEGFDGFDLDWEYPANRGGVPEDRENFDLLMAELRVECDKHGFLLTAAVSAGENTIRAAYNVPNLARYLDAIHVMAYDLHGSWEGHPYTHHHSTLYEYGMDAANNNSQLNVDYAITLWHDLGAPYEKLILGMGTYGRGFILDDPNDHGLYAPARYPISGGPFTNEAGMWGYNEICAKKMTEQWETVLDGRVQAPYSYRDRNWIGYEDIQSISRKAQYINEKGLGGGMVWSLETDDFHGTCHGETFPLIKTLHRIVNGEIVIPPTTTSTTTTRDPSAPTEAPTTTTTGAPPSTGAPEGVCQHAGKNDDPNPNDCVTFWFCTWREGTGWQADRSRCAPGTAYHPITEICDWPQNVPGCEPKPTSAPARSAADPVTGAPEGVCRKPGKNDDVNPNNCVTYWICSWTEATGWIAERQQCPAGTAYHPITEACDWPQNVPGCEPKPFGVPARA